LDGKQSHQGCSFSEEKEPKRLFESGSWALAATKPMAQSNKSFLLLFFKKEVPS
jgi:hypothetical protein